MKKNSQLKMILRSLCLLRLGLDSVYIQLRLSMILWVEKHYGKILHILHHQN